MKEGTPAGAAEQSLPRAASEGGRRCHSGCWRPRQLLVTVTSPRAASLLLLRPQAAGGQALALHREAAGQ